MNKIKLSIIGAAVLGLAAITNAQTTPPTTNAPTPNASISVATYEFETLFGLYNTNVDFYSADTVEFGLKSSLSYRTDNPGIQQELEPNFFYQVKPSMWLGAGFNIDNLGSQGTSLDGEGVHGYFKYTSHNLGAWAGLGYQGDQDANVFIRHAAEMTFGVEVFPVKNAGLFAQYGLGYDFTDSVAKGKPQPSRDYGRLNIGAVFKF